jgi:hypothetical protein
LPPERDFAAATEDEHSLQFLKGVHRMRVFTSFALVGLLALSVPVASASAGVMAPAIGHIAAQPLHDGIVQADWDHHYYQRRQEWRYEHRERWHPDYRYHHYYHRHDYRPYYGPAY